MWPTACAPGYASRLLRNLGTLATIFIVVLATGCTSLPSLDSRQPSYALEQAEADATPMGRTIAPLAKTHPGKSGIYPLAHPREAFAVRALLAGAAQRTLDVQYYIWRNDLTGTLMLESLRQAADRGVRVRFLLDDSANAGLDDTLAALDSHPNIEVRLFNPLAIRSPRWINYIADFSRVNRRMHNKSFTADNQATIIGGRNIGDEYFGATQDVLFSDLDVLAVGPVARDVSDDFDLYWNSESAYPASSLLPSAGPEALEQLHSRAKAVSERPGARPFVQAMHESSLVHELLHGSIDLKWAPAHMLSDDPRKVLGKVPKDKTVAYDLQRFFGEPQSHMELVSSYFVPTKAGVEHLVALAQQGVSIRILTNSLAATDVAAVHAGYAKRRKPLLQAGIKLYEMRPGDSDDDDRKGSGLSTGFGSSGGSGPGPFGSSGSSLHAKTLSIDDERIFVGSFNFDPRSARLNTELGFVIDSPELSRDINEAFIDRVPTTTYEVHLSENGRIYWTELSKGKTIRYDSEPHASLWRRAWVSFLSFLPIEWML